MANFMKFSDMDDIRRVCKHYERSVKNDHYGNTDIDLSKLDEDRNSNYAPERKRGQTAYIRKMMKKIAGEKRLRKDAVKLGCWVVQTPAGMEEEKKSAFFDAVYKFLVERYGTKSGLGEDVVVSAYVHHSETTDHMHFAFLPVLERNEVKSFCCKELICKSELEEFHDCLGTYLEKKGICKLSDIKNGNTQKVRTKNNKMRAKTVRELKAERKRERENAEKIQSRWNGKKTEREDRKR